MSDYDVLVVGGGAGGLMAALHPPTAGARVLLVEKDTRLGGTLHLSGGHLAAAGTRRQVELGITDTPTAHLDDIRRISHGSAREDLVGTVVAEAARMVEWLVDRGFELDPETPRIVYGHEPYRTARTIYGPDGGLSILTVLLDELARMGTEHALEVWTDTPVMGLDLTPEGRVTGIVALRRGTEVNVSADAVILATGGYAGEPELFTELEGAPLVSAGARTSTGDGLLMGQEAGARLQGAGFHLPSFGGLPDPRSPGRANWEERQVLTVERLPREIYVGRDGRRWVAEDEPSIDEKERALVALPGQVFWTVFDEAALREATDPEQFLILGRDAAEIRALANTRAGVHAAPTLEDLATAAGIDPRGLVEAVADYNAAVALQYDDAFGRTHLPAPISEGPFYAVRNHAITLVTFQGLDVDASLRVLREDGSPIEGLYALGEVIGAAATCGNSFCSGMLLTPALTFGMLLGERLGRD